MDILFAWIAAIASGIAPLVIKASSKKLIKSPWLFNILWISFRMPLVIILAIFKDGGLPKNILPIIILALCYACYYMLFTYAQYKIDVTTMSPLFTFRSIFATILGVVFLAEKITLTSFILMLIIIAFSPFASYSEKLKLKAFLSKNVAVAILAMLLLALVGYFTKVSISINGYGTTLLWQDPLILIFLMPTILLTSKDDRQVPKDRLYPFIILGIAGFVYLAASSAAYAKNLTLSSIIISLPLSMVFAYLLSRKFKNFLEEHSKKVYLIRFSAAAVMVACAIWLSLL